jgi:hypothetical protein
MQKSGYNGAQTEGPKAAQQSTMQKGTSAMTRISGVRKQPAIRAVRPTQLIVDPNQQELDMLNNPTDYFNIFKNKVAELSKTRFDEEDDELFFSYLDKLVNT